MTMINFTSNYDDLSTDRGYQFKFYCDKCHNGYMSRFQMSVTGTAGGLLRAAGSLFGGIFSSAGNSAYEIQQAIGGRAHDDALAEAVEEAKQHFHQCTRCGTWVCPEVCWNAGAGLCEGCAPKFEEEFAASHAQAKARAARDQLLEKAAAADFAAAADMSAGSVAGASAPKCPSCGTATTSKFCPDCGTPVAARLKCSGCGHEPAGAPRFCPECGDKMRTWQ
jgi:membrane protease subunit (stomatin/prohibitin family)